MSRTILYLAVALVPATSAGPQNVGQAGSFQPHNPVVFAKLFPTASQQFFTTGGLGPISTKLPEGWRHEELAYAVKQPFPITLQQYSAHIPEHVRVPVDAEGWFGLQFDYAFAKPFPVASQQYAAFQPRGTILSITPQGFFGAQYDLRFAKPFPAAEQQFTGLFKQPDALPPQGWWPYETWALKSSFPAALQQYAAFQPQGFIPEFKPPGAGRRKDFPSYIPQPAYEAKPNKPFRPVWDKPKQGTVEQIAPKPAGPPPRPPAELFGMPGQAGDAKVNAPAPLNLPSFAQYGVDDPEALGNRMRESQDMSDAIAVLKRLGLLPNT